MYKALVYLRIIDLGGEKRVLGNWTGRYLYDKSHWERIQKQRREEWWAKKHH